MQFTAICLLHQDGESTCFIRMFEAEEADDALMLMSELIDMNTVHSACITRSVPLRIVYAYDAPSEVFCLALTTQENRPCRPLYLSQGMVFVVDMSVLARS